MSPKPVTGAENVLGTFGLGTGSPFCTLNEVMIASVNTHSECGCPVSGLNTSKRTVGMCFPVLRKLKTYGLDDDSVEVKVNSLNFTFPAPAPPVADPIVVGLVAPQAKERTSTVPGMPSTVR